MLRQSLAALRLVGVATLVLGLLYPLAVLAVGRLLPDRADGSPAMDRTGQVVGSRLLGQETSGDEWFHPRPSVGEYDPLASGASNLGPENPDLLVTVERRRAEVAAREGVDPAEVPPDAVTASGSGLDPDISPAYARLQAPRVARARGLPEDEVATLVEDHVHHRQLGFLGGARVNVLELNLALEDLATGEG